MLRKQLSFFTRIPAGKHGDFQELSETQFLFPIIGIIIGLLTYLAALILSSTSFTTEINAILLLIFLYSLTGIIHLDGISDFFDGVAKSGSQSDKIDAMMDPALGVAGALTTLIALLLLFAEYEALFATQYNLGTPLLTATGFSLPKSYLFVPLVVSEVSAKLGMNTATMFSEPIGRSSAKDFMERMSWPKYLVSTMSAITIAGIINPALIGVVLVSQLAPLYLIRISRKHYGGGCGDMVGTSNEITRIFCLLLLLFL